MMTWQLGKPATNDAHTMTFASRVSFLKGPLLSLVPLVDVEGPCCMISL